MALESNKIDNQIWRFKNPSNQLKPDGKVAMVPDELRQYSEPLTSHMDIPATDSLATTFHFSGGIGSMSLEFSDEKFDHLQQMWNSPLSNAKNRDFETSIGGQGDVSLFEYVAT